MDKKFAIISNQELCLEMCKNYNRKEIKSTVIIADFYVKTWLRVNINWLVIGDWALWASMSLSSDLVEKVTILQNITLYKFPIYILRYNKIIHTFNASYEYYALCLLLPTFFQYPKHHLLPKQHEYERKFFARYS